MQKLFVSKRTKLTAIVIALVLPLLLVGFSYFHSHRPTVNVVGERTFWDYVVLNSDILLAFVFLIVCALPFFLVFEKKKPRAREMLPMAVMAALGVVGRTVFAIIPLPNFKPVTAIVIITAVSFGPEAGFMTGALTGFVSNFIFGQGPWTPWQMFCWGIIGFIAGLINKAGFFQDKREKRYFKSVLWQKICPKKTNRGDILSFIRSVSERAPMKLCLFGFFCGIVYGWIMNLYFIVGYVNPITWQTILAAYASSIFFDLSHGLCTFLVLWALADPWTRKLNRIKVKFGLVEERRNYILPPSEKPVKTGCGVMKGLA